mmetsp:Transcript_69580/g.130946  ORF Transcript_69580/g.130946 Transcript_69580/m.130946 type:complete len:201 (-) Transcript_69580:107-709(-)
MPWRENSKDRTVSPVQYRVVQDSRVSPQLEPGAVGQAGPHDPVRLPPRQCRPPPALLGRSLLLRGRHSLCFAHAATVVVVPEPVTSEPTDTVAAFIRGGGSLAAGKGGEPVVPLVFLLPAPASLERGVSEHAHGAGATQSAPRPLEVCSDEQSVPRSLGKALAHKRKTRPTPLVSPKAKVLPLHAVQRRRHGCAPLPTSV